jgi:hypothetical protein
MYPELITASLSEYGQCGDKSFISFNAQGVSLKKAESLKNTIKALMRSTAS